jgi:hypothetical protein
MTVDEGVSADQKIYRTGCQTVVLSLTRDVQLKLG